MHPFPVLARIEFLRTSACLGCLVVSTHVSIPIFADDRRSVRAPRRAAVTIAIASPSFLAAPADAATLMPQITRPEKPRSRDCESRVCSSRRTSAAEGRARIRQPREPIELFQLVLAAAYTTSASPWRGERGG
jgi:hypothetical protein